MKLPTSILQDPDFHHFMTVFYAKQGLPFFAELHAKQTRELAKLKERVL